jgi:MinD-like ATPase involved in chromosome partitioning or flagellar assembly
MVCVAPASADLAVSVRGLREGYNVNRLHDCALEFVERFRLDVLLVDTHAGVGETSLAAAALSDAALMVLRLDQQGYQGTGVLLELARRLSAPRLGLVVNQMPAHFDPAEVKTQVEQSYQAEVIAVLPHANDLLALGSAGIFVLRHPLHPLTAQLNGLAAWL